MNNTDLLISIFGTILSSASIFIAIKINVQSKKITKERYDNLLFGQRNIATRISNVDELINIMLSDIKHNKESALGYDKVIEALNDYHNYRWEDAAVKFNEATALLQPNWMIYYLLGESYNNIKTGHDMLEINSKAINAYNKALSLLPEKDVIYRAKLLIYKGAAHRRNNELEMAELSVSSGFKIAIEHGIEKTVNDGLYNLCVIYAKQGKVDKYLNVAKALCNSDSYLYDRMISKVEETAKSFSDKYDLRVELK